MKKTTKTKRRPQEAPAATPSTERRGPWEHLDDANFWLNDAQEEAVHLHFAEGCEVAAVHVSLLAGLHNAQRAMKALADELARLEADA